MSLSLSDIRYVYAIPYTAPDDIDGESKLVGESRGRAKTARSSYDGDDGGGEDAAGSEGRARSKAVL